MKASVPLILSGLMDPKLQNQVRVSKEFANRHLYYECALLRLESLKQKE